MAKEKKQANPESGLESIEQNLGRAEQFIEKNSRIITYSLIGVILVILVVMGYNKYFLKPKQLDAHELMFHPENYFKQDSLDKALNGDGINMGFLDIIDEYGSTKAGNLAHFYVGAIYMKMAQQDSSMSTAYYEDAIKHYKKFSADDMIYGPTALGRQADAYMELGDMDKAAGLYVKAAHMSDNDFTTPDFLFRAGMTYSILGDHSKALDLYKEILKNHHQSYQASFIKKYIALEESQVN